MKEGYYSFLFMVDESWMEGFIVRMDGWIYLWRWMRNVVLSMSVVVVVGIECCIGLLFVFKLKSGKREFCWGEMDSISVVFGERLRWGVRDVGEVGRRRRNF